jgi:hypothetical protein
MGTSNTRKVASASKSVTDGRSWRPTVLGFLLCVIAGGAWLMFGRGPNFAAEAETLQRQMLSTEISPQQRREMLTTLMRHVDKLDSQAQRTLMASVRQQWRDIQREDMDAYFAASEPDRQATLDRALDRLVLIADLAAAFSPGGMRVRQPRPEGAPDRKATADSQPPRQPAQDAATIAAQRKATEAYTAALEKRARERGIDVPMPGRRRQRG